MSHFKKYEEKQVEELVLGTLNLKLNYIQDIFYLSIEESSSSCVKDLFPGQPVFLLLYYFYKQK